MNLTPDKAELEPYRQRLIPAYIDYCTTVSRRSMAISIETATYLWWVCDQVAACRVLDLGSGFTSYVLHRYGRAHVVSVDDSLHWQIATGIFLNKHGLDITGLVSWKDWRRSRGGPYDVIVHDFARGDLRNESMTDAAEVLAPGGVIVFDDAQHDGHYAEMRAVAEAHGLRMVDIRDITEDAVHRYAVVAT